MIEWGISPEKITVIFNSVDTDLFCPNQKLQKEFDVISVTRFVNWKGIPELLQSCSSLHLSLLLVGSGPLEAELRELSKLLDLSVTFKTDVPNNELPHILNKARVFVLNSVYEATSYALLEAKSCGLPVIAHSSAGSAQVVNDGKDGILTGRNDQPKLFSALKVLSVDEQMRFRFGESGRKDVKERFNSQENFQEILQIAGYVF
jgi:glycosyltransferase involved in cell wall biosynthesis